MTISNMESNSGNRSWLWLVAILVMCNIALLVTIWFRPPAGKDHFPDGGNRMPPRHGAGMGPGANFSDDLKFSKDQDIKFSTMSIENRAAIDSLKRQAKNAREAFFAKIKDGTQNPAQIDSFANALGNYHRLIELQTYTHFRHVRDMLSDAQRPTFDSMIGHILRSLPEQPHFRGDSSGPDGPPHMRRGQGPGDGGPYPPPHHRRGDMPPPPPPGEGPPPPPGSGY